MRYCVNNKKKEIDLKNVLSLKKTDWINVGYILLILIVSLIVCKFILFKTGVLMVNDVDFHYARAMSTVHALMDHQLIPQLDPTAVEGFGYSWNLFYGPLPTYFIAGIFLITKNIAFSINFVSLIVVFLIGLIMYHYIKYRTQSKESSLVAALFMVTSTSVLVNIYQYSGYGPLFAFFFAIMALYGLQIILDEEKNLRGIIMLGMGGAGMLLSHSLTCLIMLIYIILLLLWQIKSCFKKILPLILAGLLSFGLSAYFLLPFIELKNLNIYNQFNEDFLRVYMWKNFLVMNLSRASVSKMLFPKGFGVTNFPNIMVFISLILCTVLFLKSKRNNDVDKLKNSSLIIFLLLGISVFIFCSNLIDWAKVPSFLWTMQYPTRIMFYASGILFSVFIGLSFSRLTQIMPRYLTLIMTVILVGGSLAMSQVSINSKSNLFRGNFDHLSKIGPSYSINGEQHLKTAIGEFFPTNIGTKEKSLPEVINETKNAFWFSNNYIYPELEKRKTKGVISLVSNQRVTLQNLKENSYRSRIEFDTNETKTGDEIELPKIYYPGYKAYVDSNGKKEQLTVKPSKDGYVQINLPKGIKGKIVSYYGLSRATLMGLSVTLLTILIVIICLLRQKCSRKNRK